MTVRNRLERLEQGRIGAGKNCPGGITAVAYKGGPLPDKMPACRRCGEPHLLLIEKVIVERGPRQ